RYVFSLRQHTLQIANSCSPKARAKTLRYPCRLVTEGAACVHERTDGYERPVDITVLCSYCGIENKQVGDRPSVFEVWHESANGVHRPADRISALRHFRDTASGRKSRGELRRRSTHVLLQLLVQPKFRGEAFN